MNKSYLQNKTIERENVDNKRQDINRANKTKIELTNKNVNTWPENVPCCIISTLK